MAKPIVTQAAVSTIAETLTTHGEEPTIIRVQERIGGGSYSTVKRYLDVWNAERQQTTPDIAVPESLAAQGSALVRAVWTQATAQAEGQTQQARDDAAAQVAQARATLADAELTIARLEDAAETQGQELATALSTIDQLQHDLADAHRARQIAETRVQESAHHADALRRDVEQHRAAAQHVARLEGEAEALRRQVADQAAMIERLGTRQT